MGQCHEILVSGFSHESISPQPQSIPLGPFQIFLIIRGVICKSRRTTGTYVEYRAVSGVFQNIDPPPPLHPANVSSPRTKGGGVHTRQVLRGWGVNILEHTRHRIGLLQYYLSATTSINNTGGKIATGINDTGSKFSLVSTTLAANFATSFASAFDTCGTLQRQY
jgi:hypothetical protein